MEEDVRLLAPEHLDEVMALIERVVGMRSQRIEQWDEIYPDRNRIRLDLEEGTAYGCFVASVLAGYLVLNTTAATEYQQLIWKDATKNYLVIHRLCVDPVHQGKGIAKRFLAFAEAFALENGGSSIRLDAFAENPRSLGLYRNQGYQEVGLVRFRKGAFVCFEKSLVGKPAGKKD